MKKKVSLPAGSCFKLGASLVVAGREAGAMLSQVEKAKRLRRFGYVMQDIKSALLNASYTKNGVSKTARELAQKTADAEFAYLNGTRPKEERTEQLKKNMTDVLAGINDLSEKVSKRCGMGAKAGDAKLRADLNNLRAKSEEKNG